MEWMLVILLVKNLGGLQDAKVFNIQAYPQAFVSVEMCKRAGDAIRQVAKDGATFYCVNTSRGTVVSVYP